jgi:hypothetical protein
MQRVENPELLNSSSNEQSDESDNYEDLVNQSSKSIVQNFFDDFKNEKKLNQNGFENFSPTQNNNNSINSSKNAKWDSNMTSKKQMEKYKIENMSNSDYSESSLNEDFNDYFK